MKRRAWLLYLCGGVLVTAAYLFVPGLRLGLVFNAIALTSPIAIVIAVRLWKPETRLPWYLFALGQTLFVAGDVITYNYDKFFQGAELPFPSIGDLFYLSVYPCLIAGILLLVHRRNPGRDRDSVIDSLIVAIGVGTIQWVYLLSPIAHDSASNLVQKLVGMAYPFMDLMLFTVVVRLAIGAGKRAPSLYLMGAAAVALFVTDTVYSYFGVQGIVYNQAGYLEAGWASFYLLWGAATLHLSMRTLADRSPDQEVRLSKPRLALLASASLMAPGVMFIQQVRHETVDMPVVIGASVALFLLVVTRMAGLVRKQEQSALREKALRTAGAALVTATNRDAIYAAAMEAARTLAGENTATRLLVGLDSNGPQEFTVVAVGGSEDIVGTTLALSALPDWKRDRLLSHRSIHASASSSEVGQILSMPADTQFVFTVPMFLKEELRALLSVASPTTIPSSTRDGLEALGSQVALALESAALTEDLLRRQSEARFRSLVQNSSDVVTVVDPDTTVRYVSPSVRRVLGYEPSELENKRFADLIHTDDKTRVLSFLGSAGGEGHPGLIEFRLQHQDGSWLHVETLRTNLLHDSNVKGIVLNTRDISERKAFEEQLAHQAFHDALTGLANRALFKDRVQHALERQRRDDQPLAVLFMDVDDFKTINDSLGHAAGDQLLKEVAERLKQCLRGVDTAARLGGDEFAVLLEDPGQGVQAADVAERIMKGLEAPISLEGKEVFARASIGIATGDAVQPGPEGAEEVLRNADVAMYMAKENGKGRYQVFEPAMHDTALKRLELKADLQRAVDNGEFVLHYQPVIVLETGRISGVEALVRWQHPVRGLVPPLDFIPLAEETGLIVSIGEWVLREAASKAREIQTRYPGSQPLHMAVNLSARQLQRPEIVDEVRLALQESGLDPSSLVLEITESVMMQDMDLSIARLSELKALGVRLAVDDFGTGYSSLNYIRRFPVDILKVDKSFVDGVSEGGEASALTAAVIELAGILKLTPVAEGIERADQLERLLELRCDLGQGFLFAKPLELAALDALLQERRAMEREIDLLSQ